MEVASRSQDKSATQAESNFNEYGQKENGRIPFMSHGCPKNTSIGIEISHTEIRRGANHDWLTPFILMLGSRRAEKADHVVLKNSMPLLEMHHMARIGNDNIILSRIRKVAEEG